MNRRSPARDCYLYRLMTWVSTTIAVLLIVAAAVSGSIIDWVLALVWAAITALHFHNTRRRRGDL